jgi:hypothetical protein
LTAAANWVDRFAKTAFVVESASPSPRSHAWMVDGLTWRTAGRRVGGVRAGGSGPRRLPGCSGRTSAPQPGLPVGLDGHLPRIGVDVRAAALVGLHCVRKRVGVDLPAVRLPALPPVQVAVDDVVPFRPVNDQSLPHAGHFSSLLPG